MPLHDLAEAIPGLIIAVLLPGFALATLLAPRWRTWERLAGAPGLSAGFFGVIGLAMRLVHIPFAPWTVLPCVVLLGAAAVVRSRRAAGDPPAAAPRWIAVPALVAGCVGAAVFAAALSGQVLPPDWDPRVHGGLATTIARTHDVLPLFPIPLQGTAFAYARPGFEAMTAAVSWIGGPPPVESMTPIITITLVLMPLGLTMLALEVTGSIGLAVVVPLVAAGMAFPSIQAVVGRYPQVVDSTLVVPLIVAALRLLRGRCSVDNGLLIVAATASVWVVHGLEVLTAALVGSVLLATAAVVALRTSGWAALVRVASAGSALAAGAALVTVLTRLPHGPPATAVDSSIAAAVSAKSPLKLHELLQFVAQTDFVSPVAIAIYCVGVAAIIIRRRMLWVLLVHVVLLLAMADSLYWRHLGSLWRNVLFPYGDVDRLVGVQYWVLPFIVGAGLLAVADVMRRLASRRRWAVGATVAAVAVALLAVLLHGPLDRRYVQVFGAPTVIVLPLGVFDGLAHLAPWRLTIAAALGALVLGWVALCLRMGVPAALRSRLRIPPALDAAAVAVAVVALISLAVGARAEFAQYDRAVAERATATAADVAVLQRMSALLPQGTLVLTDGLTDAGIWVASLTDLTPLVPNSSEGGTLSTPLVTALADACTDPGAAAAAAKRAGAVFVGSHHVPGQPNPWNEACIARVPGLRMVASDSSSGAPAAAFVVTR